MTQTLPAPASARVNLRYTDGDGSVTSLSEIGATRPTPAPTAHPARTSRRATANLTGAAVFVASVLFVVPGFAKPPPGVSSTGPVAAWVRTWVNAQKELCCGLESDCRPTQIIENPDSPSGYDAWIDHETYENTTSPDWVGKFVHIPVKAFSRQSEDNPTGVSWACFYQSEVRCASLAGGS